MSAPHPQHLSWDEVESQPLFGFGERVTFKALTGQTVQLMRVRLAAGVTFPDPEDPTQVEVHDNEQVSTVLSGEMRLVIGAEQFIVSAGESIAIPPGAPHRAEFLQETEMLEVFTPPMPLS